MFRWFRQWKRRRTLRDRPILDADWNATLERVPMLKALGLEEQARLRAMATWFLDEKDFYGAGGRAGIRPELPGLERARSGVAIPPRGVGIEGDVRHRPTPGFPAARQRRPNEHLKAAACKDKSRVPVGSFFAQNVALL